MDSAPNPYVVSPNPVPPVNIIPPIPPTPAPGGNNSSRIPGLKFMAVAAGTLLAVILVFIVSLIYFSQKPKKSPVSNIEIVPVTAISGTFDLNGEIPPQSTITIGERKVGDPAFTIISGNLKAVDGEMWVWNGAQPGVEYELQANLLNNNTTIARSDAHVIAAPASGETLRINVIALPTPSLAVSPTGIPPGGGSTPVPSAVVITYASISGVIDLNGYVPPSSTISLAQRRVGDPTFNIVVAGIPAADRASWIWNGAVAGQLYEIKAILLSGGITAAQSIIIPVSAPADNEIMVINSAAVPSANQSGVISGKFDLNGVIPSGSNIALGVRKSGSNSGFNIVSNYPAIDNTAWSWTGAQSGITYDLLAYLQVNGSNYTHSQLLVRPAPAADEILIINSQNLPPPPPANSIGYTCNGKNSNNLWQVTVGYNNNSPNRDAQQYMIQIGSSPQNSEFYNVTLNPPNPSQSQSVTTGYVLTEGTTYWLKYAYAVCPNCSVFSPFSQAVQLSCASPAPTSTPSLTPIPSATSIPSPTIPPLLPTPSETPTLLPTETIPPVPTN